MEIKSRRDLYLLPLAGTYFSLGLSSDNLIQIVLFVLTAMVTFATFMQRQSPDISQ